MRQIQMRKPNRSRINIAMVSAFLLILSFVHTSLPQTQQDSGTAQKKDPSVINIAKETKDIVDEAHTMKAEEVYNIIRQNIADLDELVQVVNSASDPEEVIDRVIESLERMAESYEKIAKMSPTLEEEFKKKSSRLRELNGESTAITTDLEKTVNELEAEKYQLYRLPPRRQEIRSKTIDLKIKFIEQRISLMEGFTARHKQIAEGLDAFDDAVLDFLYVIRNNAEVYEEALELVKLRRDLRDAVRIDKDILELNQLTTDVINSWTQLNNLIEQMLKDVEKLNI